MKAPVCAGALVPIRMTYTVSIALSTDLNVILPYCTALEVRQFAPKTYVMRHINIDTMLSDTFHSGWVFFPTVYIATVVYSRTLLVLAMTICQDGSTINIVVSTPAQLLQLATEWSPRVDLKIAQNNANWRGTGRKWSLWSQFRKQFLRQLHRLHLRYHYDFTSL